MCRCIQQQMSTMGYKYIIEDGTFRLWLRSAVLLDIPQRGGYNMRYLGIVCSVMGICALKTKLQG